MSAHCAPRAPQPPTLVSIEHHGWGIIAFHRGTAEQLIAAGLVVAENLSLGKSRQRIGISEFGDRRVVIRRGCGIYALEIHIGKNDNYADVGAASRLWRPLRSQVYATVDRILSAAARSG